MANIEQDAAIDIPLQREKDCDVTETAAWLTTLLHCIYENVRCMNSEHGLFHLQIIFSAEVPHELPRV